MKNFSKFTKATLSIGLLFVIYGYVCRATGLYFFWESKSIGWAVIFIGLIGLLSDRVRIKKKDKKKSTLEKITPKEFAPNLEKTSSKFRNILLEFKILERLEKEIALLPRK